MEEKNNGWDDNQIESTLCKYGIIKFLKQLIK